MEPVAPSPAPVAQPPDPRVIRLVKLGVLAMALLLVGTLVHHAIWPDNPGPVITAKVTNQESANAVPVPDVELVHQSGRTMRLSDLAGQPYLLYFGYTSCQQRCALSMDVIANAKRQLGNAANRMRWVFVTLDPERDTPDRITSYVGGYDLAFYGFTGSADALATLAKAFGVEPKRTGTGATAGFEWPNGYYLVDGAGRLRATLNEGATSPQIAAAVRTLQKESQ